MIFAFKFRVNWLFGSGEKIQKDFQDGGHGGYLRFRIGMILAIFDLQVTPIFPNKFRVNQLSVQEENFEKDFQDDGHSDHLGFSVQEKKYKKIFKMVIMAAILDFWSERF